MKRGHRVSHGQTTSKGFVSCTLEQDDSVRVSWGIETILGTSETIAGLVGDELERSPRWPRETAAVVKKVLDGKVHAVPSGAESDFVDYYGPCRFRDEEIDHKHRRDGRVVVSSSKRGGNERMMH